jgi:glycosyl transferase family 11
VKIGTTGDSPKEEKKEDATGGGSVLTMSTIGKFGRFGNQIFEYAFLRICARASNAGVECAVWPGQPLFGHYDPPVSGGRVPRVERGSNLDGILVAVPEFMPYLERATAKLPERIGVEAMTEGVEPGEIIGLFQWHTGAYRPFKDFFRSLFQPCDDLREWIDEPLKLMRRRGKTIVAVHLRTGDYKFLPQFSWTLMVPPQWWVKWLDSIWDKLDEPVLYLCSNDVSAVRHWFAKYNPVTADDLEVDTPERLKGLGVGFYRDYYVMTQADVLAISNSTFSFSAAMLNERAQRFVRPTWDFQNPIVDFDPWDSSPLLFLDGADAKLKKRYGQMMRIERELKGRRSALAAALLYRPAGSVLMLWIRFRLAYAGRGLRGVFDFLLRRTPPRSASLLL